MLKRFIPLAATSVALLAFAAPAAQATGPLITDAKGEAATAINAESTNTKTVTANGTLECATVQLSGKWTENANTTAAGSATGVWKGTVGVAPHTNHCAFGTIQTDILALTVKRLHLIKNGSATEGTIDFSYTYQLTTIFGTFHCTFGVDEAEEGKQLPIVKRTGALTINVSGNLKKITGGGFCPETGTIHGDFIVRDQNGELVNIH